MNNKERRKNNKKERKMKDEQEEKRIFVFWEARTRRNKRIRRKEKANS